MRKCTLKIAYGKDSKYLIQDRHPRKLSLKGNKIKQRNESYKLTCRHKSQSKKPEPLICNAIHVRRSSEEERRVDALALRADERRDKLRKASGRSKYPLIRRYLNGATRQRRPLSSIRQSITYGREPGELKHLSSQRKRKKTRFLE